MDECASNSARGQQTLRGRCCYYVCVCARCSVRAHARRREGPRRHTVLVHYRCFPSLRNLAQPAIVARAFGGRTLQRHVSDGGGSLAHNSNNGLRKQRVCPGRRSSSSCGAAACAPQSPPPYHSLAAADVLHDTLTRFLPFLKVGAASSTLPEHACIGGASMQTLPHWTLFHLIAPCRASQHPLALPCLLQRPSRPGSHLTRCTPARAPAPGSSRLRTPTKLAALLFLFFLPVTCATLVRFRAHPAALPPSYLPSPRPHATCGGERCCAGC